jgi:hypothetical protein
MKQVTILAMTSSITTMKFNGETHPDKAYVAMIHCPGAPTLTGVPSLVSIDSNQNCKIIIENCAPYEVTIERNDLMGIVEIEEDEMYPLTDKAATDICSAIKSNIPKTPQTRLTREDIQAMQPKSSRGIQGSVPGHPFQAPGCHQRGQIQPGAGQELQA